MLTCGSVRHFVKLSPRHEVATTGHPVVSAPASGKEPVEKVWKGKGPSTHWNVECGMWLGEFWKEHQIKTRFKYKNNCFIFSNDIAAIHCEAIIVLQASFRLLSWLPVWAPSSSSVDADWFANIEQLKVLQRPCEVKEPKGLFSVLFCAAKC